jgi:opacity protein-like surface antigen
MLMAESIEKVNNLDDRKEFIVVKNLLMVMLCSTLGGTLYANDDISKSRTFVGMEIGSAQIEANTYGPFGENDHKSEYNIEYGLRLGAQNGKWRTSLIVNYFDSTDDDQKYYKGLATFDYLLTENSSFKPFIGVNAGYMNYTTSNPNGNDEDNSFLYGGQVGVIFNISDEVQLDLSYRYSLSSSEYVNSTGSFLFGLNYIINK